MDVCSWTRLVRSSSSSHKLVTLISLSWTFFGPQVLYKPRKTRCTNSLPFTRKGHLDLLYLPETALTGYVFPTPKDVLHYLEELETEPTSQLCRELVKELDCFVVAGYPEKLPESVQQLPHQVAANSAIVYDPEGNYVVNHQKVNMFESDLPWVHPGKGFTCLRDLLPPFGTVTIGICMDLSPLPDFTDQSHVLVILCAWLDSKENSHSAWDMTTIQFWIERLLPLWSKTSPDLRHIEGMEASDDHDETIVVICNCTGLERGSLFCGCSLLLGCSRVDKVFEGTAFWIVE
ncbi:carbon-nitrogen hydrolase [Serendipita vermifera]|nr:carbon-nitrogen hydrolase [Serendipita vermifera]